MFNARVPVTVSDIWDESSRAELARQWSEVLADPVIADAIRIVSSAPLSQSRSPAESYSGVKPRKLANKKKDA
jgi:hypothetical protein